MDSAFHTAALYDPLTKKLSHKHVQDVYFNVHSTYMEPEKKYRTRIDLPESQLESITEHCRFLMEDSDTKRVEAQESDSEEQGTIDPTLEHTSTESPPINKTSTSQDNHNNLSRNQNKNWRAEVPTETTQNKVWSNNIITGLPERRHWTSQESLRGNNN